MSVNNWPIAPTTHVHDDQSTVHSFLSDQQLERLIVLRGARARAGPRLHRVRRHRRPDGLHPAADKLDRDLAIRAEPLQRRAQQQAMCRSGD